MSSVYEQAARARKVNALVDAARDIDVDPADLDDAGWLALEAAAGTRPASDATRAAVVARHRGEPAPAAPPPDDLPPARAGVLEPGPFRKAYTPDLTVDALAEVEERLGSEHARRAAAGKPREGAGWYKGFSKMERRESAGKTYRAMGKTPTGPCDLCGRPGEQWHNEDYAHPTLYVVAVCRRCHKALHLRFRDPAGWRRYLERHLVRGPIPGAGTCRDADDLRLL